MNRLWKLVRSSSAGENEFSLLMILQVARCVRMQLYRITLSHLYRKLLVTRFHSTVSVLRPTALTSLWLKKKEEQQESIWLTYTIGVFGRAVRHGVRPPLPMLFSCCLSDDRLSRCQTSAPLLLCLSGGGVRREGRWELAWTCDKVKVGSDQLGKCGCCAFITLQPSASM